MTKPGAPPASGVFIFARQNTPASSMKGWCLLCSIELRNSDLPLLWPLPHGWGYPLAKAFLGRGVLEVCAVAAQSEDQSSYRQ